MSDDREYRWSTEALDAVAERGWTSPAIRGALYSPAAVDHPVGDDMVVVFTPFPLSPTGVLTVVCTRRVAGVDAWLIVRVFPTRGDDLAEYERRAK